MTILFLSDLKLSVVQTLVAISTTSSIELTSVHFSAVNSTHPLLSSTGQVVFLFGRMIWFGMAGQSGVYND